MAHFVRTQPDGVWVTGYVPPPSDWRSLDLKTFKAVNGDEGGTWAPSSPIELGGQGLLLAGPNHQLEASGVLFLDDGSKLWISTGSDHVIEGGYVRYGTGHEARNLVRLYNATDLYMNTPGPASVNESVLDGAAIKRTGLSLEVMLFRVYAPDGATLKTVDCTIVPGSTHSGLPATYQKFGVFRVSQTANLESLFSLNLGYAAFDAGVGGLTAWNNSLPKTASWAADQRNVIDRANWSYVVRFYDEEGANAVIGTDVVSFKFTWDIPDIRPF